MKGRGFVQLPADLDDPFHPNIRWVPLPRNTNVAFKDYFERFEACPACEHSPHPTGNRLEELRMMPYKEYLKTPEWQRTRTAKLEQAGHQCRRCGEGRKLRVHHLTYDHAGHEWLDELVVLCGWCHGYVHEERHDQRQQRRRR